MSIVLIASVLGPRASVRPVFADASICGSPGFVFQRAPLTGQPVLPQVINTAEISVTISDSPDPITHGNTLTYTIEVNNTGPQNATDIVLTDILPAGTTFVSINEPNCWTCTTPPVGTNGTVSCEHPGLGVGASDVFNLVVQVTDAVPAGVPLLNTASIVANVIDPAGGDRDAQSSTTVLALTPTPTATPTITLTPTQTLTSTVTATPAATLTPTVTPTGTLIPLPTGTATATSTSVPAVGPTSTVTPTVPPTRPATDDTDKSRKQTEQQRQQDDHTNRSGRDDYYTEGNVVEVVLDAAQPYAVIATRDGLVTVLLNCDGGCGTVRVGDYLEVDGVKENEQLFDADEVTVSR